MNSDDVRVFVKDVIEKGLDNHPKFQQKAEKAKIVLLGEIASHLSDLLDHFRKVDESVFGAPPKKEAKKNGN